MTKLCKYTLVLFHFSPFLVKPTASMKLPFAYWTLHLATPEDFNYILNLILLSPSPPPFPHITLLRGPCQFLLKSLLRHYLEFSDGKLFHDLDLKIMLSHEIKLRKSAR